MRPASLAVALLVALPAWAARPRALFLGVEASTGIDEADARAAEQLLAGALDETAAFVLTTRRDVSGLLQAEALKQAVGADDPAQLGRLAGSVDARYVATAQLARLGDDFVISLALLDAAAGRSLGRGTRAGAKAQLPAFAAELARGVVARAAVPPEPPPPAQAPPAAVAAFERARQAYRDGALVLVDAQRAVSLDPSYASAHLLVALDTTEPREARASLDAARAASQRLSAPERASLAAADACWRDGWASAACEQAWAAASAADPKDGELLTNLGRARLSRGRPEDAIAAFREAQSVDPTLGRAVVGEARAVMGRLDRAAIEAALLKCLEAAPHASICLNLAAFWAESDGRAAVLETVARRMLALRPDEAASHSRLALALDCRDAPEAAVRAALAKAWERLPEADRAEARRSDEATLAFRAGRFAEAARIADEDVAALAGRDAPESLVGNAAVVVAIALETGALTRAERSLAAIEAALDAGAQDPAEPRLAVRVLRHRLAKKPPLAAIDGLSARWSAAAAAMAADKFRLLSLWARYWGAGVVDEADAHEALARLSALGSLPAPDALWLAGAAHLGRALSLAGRHAEALPYLARAARSCSYDPTVTLPARMSYAKSLSATGAAPAARAEYEAVLKRWEKVRPAPSSAAAARKALSGTKAR